MLSVIRELLVSLIDRIDAGNSNLTEDEEQQIVDLLKNISEPRLSKYQACRLLNISRAKFDNLVAEGRLPKGTKQQGFKELSWKKNDILKYLHNNSLL